MELILFFFCFDGPLPGGQCSGSKPFVFGFCLGLRESRHELVPVKTGIFAAEVFGFGEIPIFFHSPKCPKSLKTPWLFSFWSNSQGLQKTNMSPKVAGEFHPHQAKIQENSQLKMMILSSFLNGDIIRKKRFESF